MRIKGQKKMVANGFVCLALSWDDPTLEFAKGWNGLQCSRGRYGVGE